VDVFAALADPVRRQLLAAVAAEPRRVVDLAAGQTISRPAVSRHLRLLTQAGLVEAHDRGRERYYGLRPERLTDVVALVDQLMAARPAGIVSAQALDALATEVHRTTRERRRTTRTSATRTEEIA
jgi:DNA-binding transcriptional ArsR family regulator